MPAPCPPMGIGSLGSCSVSSMHRTCMALVIGKGSYPMKAKMPHMMRSVSWLVS